MASLLLLVCVTDGHGQALDQFKPATSAAERRLYRNAIAACEIQIKRRTAGAGIDIFGPCADKSGKWTGISRVTDGLIVNFSVEDSKNPSGVFALNEF